MRIAFLYAELSAYFMACLQALRKREDVQLMLMHKPSINEALYQPTRAMIQMSSMPKLEWEILSKRGFELSKMFAPERWADTLIYYSEKHPKFLKKQIELRIAHF